ncbi:MAG: hypothetical protein ABSC89_12245 [Verrucomicrobiota bacterium]|jgi:hypothetical protein
MFSFFKQRESAQDVAEGFFDSIRENTESGYPKKMFPDEAPLGMDLIKDEWIYFDIFIFDYVTFLAFGETPARHAILNPFSSLVTNWLKNRQAPPITEPRIIINFDNIDKPPKTFDQEERESAHERLKRRVLIYAEALKTPCSLGQNYMIALTFATLCGVDVIEDNSYVMGISAYFSQRKIEQTKYLKSLRLS